MKAFKGNIVYTKVPQSFEIAEQSYILVDEKGRIECIAKELPDGFDPNNTEDFGNQMIIPGFTDLHLHPNQYPDNGLGYDLELMEWIEQYATPVTELYREEETARKILSKFVEELWRYGILHSVQFGALDYQTNDILFELMIQSGLYCYLGKNHTDYKKDKHDVETTQESMQTALALIQKWEGKSDRVHYIMTPSFAPGCTEEIMKWTGDMARRYHMPLQSHLDENVKEVSMVLKRFTDCRNYAEVYQKNKIFGNDIKTIMAHCIHTTEDEIQALRYSNVFVAHCPHSNCNLGSGIMPVRRYLDSGIRVGIGSDISAGHTLNMMDNMRAAIEMSKILYVEEGKAPLSVSEAFYLATKGGGEFFGEVGSFEPGYLFNALVVDDDALAPLQKHTAADRIERFIYSGDERQIKRRFIEGQEVPRPFFGHKGGRHEDF